MATVTRAGTKLARALAPGPKQRMSAADLARICRVSPATVWAWRHQEHRPGPLMRKIIERVLGIPESEWLTREERGALAA